MPKSDVPEDFRSKIKKKKVKTGSELILLDPDLGEELDAAKVTLGKLLIQRGNTSAPSESLENAIKLAEKEVDELLVEVDENTVEFKFRSIGRNGMDVLISEHAPTSKQVAEARKQGETDLQYNPETFPQALISACSYEPKLTIDEVQELWDSSDWNTAELVKLFVKAQEVNAYYKDLEVKKGSRPIRG